MEITLFCTIIKQFLKILKFLGNINITDYQFKNIKQKHIPIYFNKDIISIIHVCQFNDNEIIEYSSDWEKYILKVAKLIVCNCQSCNKLCVVEISKGCYNEQQILNKNIWIKQTDSVSDLIDCRSATNKSKSVDKKSIVYLVNNCLPEIINGYTIRTHEILKNLKMYYLNIYCVVKLQISQSQEDHINIVSYDNIQYYILRTNKHIKQCDKKTLYSAEYIKEYQDKLEQFCIEYNINTIHSCSNYINAMVGNNVASILNLKNIYEIRGLWHLSRISFDPSYKNTLECKKYIDNETTVMKNADYLITIHDLMADYINNNIINKDIMVIPNCVNVNKWSPTTYKNLRIMKLFNLGGFIIFGYIGSTVNYEGLDTLIFAINNVIKKGHRVKLLIVGKGFTNACTKTFNTLNELIDKLNIHDNVILVGQVNNNVIKDYYSVIDVICIPRKNYLVCNLVPPIKIYEAMSMSKAIIASDVEPLKKIINHNNTGLIFESNNIKSLEDNIKYIISNTNKIKMYGSNARKWIVKNNQWFHYLDKLVELYN